MLDSSPNTSWLFSAWSITCWPLSIFLMSGLIALISILRLAVGEGGASIASSSSLEGVALLHFKLSLNVLSLFWLPLVSSLTRSLSAKPFVSEKLLWKFPTCPFCNPHFLCKCFRFLDIREADRFILFSLPFRQFLLLGLPASVSQHIFKSCFQTVWVSTVFSERSVNRNCMSAIFLGLLLFVDIRPILLTSAIPANVIFMLSTYLELTKLCCIFFKLWTTLQTFELQTTSQTNMFTSINPWRQTWIFFIINLTADDEKKLATLLTMIHMFCCHVKFMFKKVAYLIKHKHTHLFKSGL